MNKIFANYSLFTYLYFWFWYGRVRVSGEGVL